MNLYALASRSLLESNHFSLKNIILHITGSTEMRDIHKTDRDILTPGGKMQLNAEK